MLIFCSLASGIQIFMAFDLTDDRKQINVVRPAAALQQDFPEILNFFIDFLIPAGSVLPVSVFAPLACFLRLPVCLSGRGFFCDPVFYPRLIAFSDPVVPGFPVRPAGLPAGLSVFLCFPLCFPIRQILSEHVQELLEVRSS